MGGKETGCSGLESGLVGAVCLVFVRDEVETGLLLTGREDNIGRGSRHSMLSYVNQDHTRIR